MRATCIFELRYLPTRAPCDVRYWHSVWSRAIYPGICLRARCAVSGTDIRYAATRRKTRIKSARSVPLPKARNQTPEKHRPVQFVPGTWAVVFDFALSPDVWYCVVCFGATSTTAAVASRCPVLTLTMLLQAVVDTLGKAFDGVAMGREVRPPYYYR
eukprot:1730476-Rhodomonas_salina.3